MSPIEIILCLLLLFMAVPDGCRRLRRPALAYPVFVLAGLLLGPFLEVKVGAILREAGSFGFLLLLFEVGLEIDLPGIHAIRRALRFALPWIALQYPLILLLGHVAGLGLAHSLFAAAALTGVSVGMAQPAWKALTGVDEAERTNLLHVLVVLETLAILVLAVGGPAVKSGWNWMIPLRLAGICLVLALIGRFGRQLTAVFQSVLERGTHWRTHLLVLLILAVCAIGERLGLSGAKTAFFLGLFMSRAEHDGRGLEHAIAPISRQFLIPLFFVSLGLHLDTGVLFSLKGLAALGSAAVIIVFREVIHRRWLGRGQPAITYLVLTPNLPVVALAASTLLDAGVDAGSIGWVLAVSLFVSLAAILMLPPVDAEEA